MRQAIIKKGIVVSEEIPAPVVSPGSLLIKVVNSCISAGTEMRGVKSSGTSLFKRALERPEKVKKVLNMVRSIGFAKAYQAISGKLDSGVATGYSVAGVVIGIGQGVTGFEIGDHVAAAGAGLANHAEYVNVPVNLAVKMPPGMDFHIASTVTLGSIALHGVRRADLKMGEFGIVFGCGILGLLTVQMLRLSGVRVIVVELDNRRLSLAGHFGAEHVVNPNDEDPVNIVEHCTAGRGADAVLFTAAAEKSEALSQSFRMCRKKGRVVLIGVVGMSVNREDMYEKELDLIMSTSYGPGRYDAAYEEKGIDYPYGYVRWTENRNMEEYLRLVHNGQVKLDELIDARYPIEQVTEAFKALEETDNRPVLVCLDYGRPIPKKISELTSHTRKLSVVPSPIKKGIVNVALVGAGGFANAVHLPNIQKLSSTFKLHSVMSRDGHKAKAYARQYGSRYATTDLSDILNDDDVDLILICTRHDSHAELTLKALMAGKNVLVEKPLAINQKELDDIKSYYEKNESGKPFLMVGFNRRFSRCAREIKKHTLQRIGPLFIRYRMNAGALPPDHWVYSQGGRIIGEACHIIDLMTYFTETEIISISSESLALPDAASKNPDSKSFILKYKDGSICTIDYFAVGNNEFPKEYMEIHFDGKTIVLDDFKSLHGFGLKMSGISTSASRKGHLEELEAAADFLTGKRNKLPIELWDMIQTTAATFIIQ